jgi:hypothetical protein
MCGAGLVRDRAGRGRPLKILSHVYNQGYGHILSAFTGSASTVHVFRRPIGAKRSCNLTPSITVFMRGGLAHYSSTIITNILSCPGGGHGGIVPAQLLPACQRGGGRPAPCAAAYPIPGQSQVFMYCTNTTLLYKCTVGTIADIISV